MLFVAIEMSLNIQRIIVIGCFTPLLGCFPANTELKAFLLSIYIVYKLREI